MHVLSLFLASLPIAALGSTHNHHRRMSASRLVRKNNPSYTLRVQHKGQSFFDGWDFFTGDDPTGGNVNFLSRTDAATAGLAYVQSDGTAVMSVDSNSQVPPGGKRNSVRISTKDTYNDGLIIADIWKIPHGLTVWPAFWTNGPHWPYSGEMDIIEYVNDAKTNQYTLHTGSGSNCTLNANPQSAYANSQGKAFLGNVMGTKCPSKDGDNAGCAFGDSGTGSTGTDFNKGSGGVFALLWDSTQVSIWRFPRGQIPQDITNGQPEPALWDVPMAFWSSDSCDIKSNFYSHSLIFDITICGGWAESAYSNAGYGSCTDAVANNSNYNWAQWKINYVSVYGASS